MKDWVEDESLSREQTLARFEALAPQRTTGPSDLRVMTAAMIEQGWSLVRVEGNRAQHHGFTVRDVGSVVIKR